MFMEWMNYHILIISDGANGNVFLSRAKVFQFCW